MGGGHQKSTEDYRWGVGGNQKITEYVFLGDGATSLLSVYPVFSGVWWCSVVSILIIFVPKSATRGGVSFHENYICQQRQCSLSEPKLSSEE